MDILLVCKHVNTGFQILIGEIQIFYLKLVQRSEIYCVYYLVINIIRFLCVLGHWDYQNAFKPHTL